MLFYLSDSLVSDTISHERKIVISRGIDNILRSLWESKHLVYATIDTLTKLQNYQLSYDSNCVINNLLNNYSFLNYSEIKHYVEVIEDSRHIEKIKGDQIIIRMSINEFQNCDLLQETRIICEDPSDASLFEIICNYYIKINNIGNISIRYEPESGGGGNICQCLKKHIIKSNKFCLVFCDSDVKYPNCAHGSTISELYKVSRDGNLFEIIEITCHEIENLIPFNYLDDIKENSHLESGILFINKIFNSESKELLKYCDIKKGINKKKITVDQQYYEFTKKLIPFCNTVNEITEIETKEDSFQIIPQVGKIVSSFVKKHYILYKLTPIFLEYQKKEWEKIGSYFLYWSCARNKEPLNT